jgi:hypothetical protein
MQPAGNHNLIVSLSYSAAINIVVTGEPQCVAGRAANFLTALVPNQPYVKGGTLNELAGDSTSYRTQRFIPVITRAAPQLRRIFSTKHDQVEKSDALPYNLASPMRHTRASQWSLCR